MHRIPCVLKAATVWGLLAGPWCATAPADEDATAGRAPVSVQKPDGASNASAPEEPEKVADGAEEFKSTSDRPTRAPSTTAVGGTAEWLKDPFRYVASDMADAVADLGKSETHIPATEIQPRILSRLDVLVEMLEKACKKGGGGAAGGNPIRPANASTLGGGPGGRGPLRNPDQSRRDWASLTPKERERILQSQSQGFPPGYEDLLAEYFRRLAQGESPRNDEAGDTSPADAAGR